MEETVRQRENVLTAVGQEQSNSCAKFPEQVLPTAEASPGTGIAAAGADPVPGGADRSNERPVEPSSAHCAATEDVAEVLEDLAGVLDAPEDFAEASEVCPEVLDEPEDVPEVLNDPENVQEVLEAPSPEDRSSGAVLNLLDPVREITGAWKDFRRDTGECFTKGCKWSPDGTCLLTNSEDNVLRIFDLPSELHCQESWSKDRTLTEMRAVLKMAEGGLVYDYCWYPLMSSWDPLSCCLLSTSQNSPVHLWDAFTGQLRATYRGYDQYDEVESAHSVTFDKLGEKLYAGYKGVVRVFNTAIPGRGCETRKLKDADVAESQRGIVSCVSVNPSVASIYAVGTYLKSVGLYSEPHGAALCLMSGHTGGVTHLTFSPDGTKLFSGGRKDPEIICWDIRNPGNVLYVVHRQVTTNQRITFDVSSDGRYLISGGSDGHVTCWDLNASPGHTPASQDPVLPPCQRFLAHADCANGVSIHQQYPILATSSGQRHFAEVSQDSSDTDSTSPLLKRKYIKRENSVKLWWAANVA